MIGNATIAGGFGCPGVKGEKANSILALCVRAGLGKIYRLVPGHE